MWARPLQTFNGSSRILVWCCLPRQNPPAGSRPDHNLCPRMLCKDLQTSGVRVELSRGSDHTRNSVTSRSAASPPTTLQAEVTCRWKGSVTPRPKPPCRNLPQPTRYTCLVRLVLGIPGRYSHQSGNIPTGRQVHVTQTMVNKSHERMVQCKLGLRWSHEWVSPCHH